MKPQGLVNRTVNLVSTAIVALAGFAYAPEMFTEDKELFTLDDQLLFGLGIVATYWYLKGKNKFKRSVVPVIFVWTGLLIKLMGIGHEFRVKDDLADDIGGVMLFLLASILVAYLYISAKKLISKTTE